MTPIELALRTGTVSANGASATASAAAHKAILRRLSLR